MGLQRRWAHLERRGKRDPLSGRKRRFSQISDRGIF